jgi:hypothetical protein
VRRLAEIGSTFHASIVTSPMPVACTRISGAVEP